VYENILKSGQKQPRMVSIKVKWYMYVIVLTWIHKWNEPCLPLLPSCRASLHFGWYSLPIPLRVGGWVELAWMAAYIWRWFPRPKTFTHPSTNQSRCRVTSLVLPTPLLLCQITEGTTYIPTAAITLGIGQHSSFRLIIKASLLKIVYYSELKLDLLM